VIDELADHPAVIMAARIAKTFSLDPVAVLDDGGDELLNLVRSAATMVVQRDEEKQADEAKSKARRR
jgi:hypothetical protein